MTSVKFPNKRMSSIKMSGGIREILSRANELEKEGRSIIHMEIGRPDFDSPACAKEAVKSALDSGDVHYTNMQGTEELREAVAEKYRMENRMQVDAQRGVVITNGAMEAITASLLTILDPGDEIIVPSPYFSAYADEIALTGAVMVNVPTSMERGFALSVDDIAEAITPRTKAILINTPNNPSGAVLTRGNLEEIAALAISKDLLVISDECYEKFLYEGEHVSIGSFKGMEERTVTVSAASKTWSMTGWRIGWAVSPEEMTPYLNKCHQNLTTCANSFAQAGVTAAFAHADGDVKKMIAEYGRRRDMVAQWIGRIEGFEAIKPSGAFYAFPRISSLNMDGFKFCSWLLENAGVSVVPGEVFGAAGHIRIAYCREYDYIEEGMRRIKEAVDGLRAGSRK